MTIEGRVGALVDAVAERQFWARTALPEVFPRVLPSGSQYWLDTNGRPIYEPREEVLRRCAADLKIIEAYVAARNASYRMGTTPAVLPGLLIAMEALAEGYAIESEEKR